MKTFVASLIVVLFVSIGCGQSDQDLPEAQLSPEAIGQSDFRSVCVVSRVTDTGWYDWRKECDDTANPLYLVDNQQAYVIPAALRGTLGNRLAGSILNCPPQLYKQWTPATDSETLVKECGPHRFSGSNQLVEYRVTRTEDSGSVRGYNSRLMQTQSWKPEVVSNVGAGTTQTTSLARK